MARSTVADLTVDEFKELVRDVVVQTLSEMIVDPDEGLQLRDDFKVSLQRSLALAEAGDRTVPVEKVATDSGLAW